VTPSPLSSSDPHHIGPYRLLGRLGAGGMGTVYLGESPAGRRVAVKVIRPELASDPDFRARFRGEVKRAGQVPPFCTAEVLDADAEHATPYLVVEYVGGPSLADVIHDRGPLTGVAVGVATALAAIHDAGVVHRDLKPANVLFSLGTPKVIDFGIAKALDTTNQHTIAGHLFGTIAYMAPERFDPDAAAHVGPSTDIFAWGAVVTYAATGRTPFSTDALVATAQGVALPAPHLHNLSSPLRDLVAAALHPDPKRRPTAQDLVEYLLKAGAAGNTAIRAGLDRQPELRRAASAVRHTLHGPQPTGLTNGARLYRRVRTLVDHRHWTARRLTPSTVAAITAIALAMAIAIYPATRRLTIAADPPVASQHTAPAPDLTDRNGTSDRANRGSDRGNCTIEVLDLTAADNTFTCPATSAPPHQTFRALLRFDTPAACLAIRVHVTPTANYQITACRTHISLKFTEGRHTRPIKYHELDQRLDAGRWHQIDLKTSPRGITVDINDHQVINMPRPMSNRTRGTVAVGITPAPDAPALDADAHLTLTDVSIRPT
jgi:predicted Ser/Thr protein kinase